MAQVAISVADRHGTATVAGWRVSLELGELCIPGILSDRCRGYIPNRRSIRQADEFRFRVVGNGVGLGTISIDWGCGDVPLGSGARSDFAS